jgi:hypothetical protein
LFYHNPPLRDRRDNFGGLHDRGGQQMSEYRHEYSFQITSPTFFGLELMFTVRMHRAAAKHHENI